MAGVAQQTSMTVIPYRLGITDAVHHLFIKQHQVAIAELSREKPPGRTILCHNVLPFLKEVRFLNV